MAVKVDALERMFMVNILFLLDTSADKPYYIEVDRKPNQNQNQMFIHTLHPFNFAGINVESFQNTENDISYVTFGGFEEEMKFSRQNLSDWLDRTGNKSKGMEVRVGIRKVPAKAYPVAVVMDYFIYRLMDLGDVQVLALFASCFCADLDTAVKNSKLKATDFPDFRDLSVKRDRKRNRK